MQSMEKKHIGWIGTGVMGLNMAMRLLDAGYALTVYNRTASKAQPLVKKGARLAVSPAEVAETADIVFTMVGYPKDVNEVYFGSNGIFSTARTGQLLVDMTTTEPSLAIKIAEKAGAIGAAALDAPVSGGDIGAQKGTLSIMVGGEESAFREALPYLQVMGKNITLEGKSGAGQHTKMANQIVIAGTMGGVCEALLYGRKAGLDLTRLVDTIKAGAAGCWTLDNLAPRIIAGNYNPGFYVDHFVKDMGIALDEAKRMKLSLPTLALVNQLYVAMQGHGRGKMGTQALVLALDDLNGSGLFGLKEQK
jgi:3-hydroxyisobutyrate dehydrogenase